MKGAKITYPSPSPRLAKISLVVSNLLCVARKIPSIINRKRNAGIACNMMSVSNCIAGSFSELLLLTPRSYYADKGSENWFLLQVERFLQKSLNAE